MIINTNRILLDFFTNTTTHNKSRDSYSLNEMISMCFDGYAVVCFCRLNYKKSIQLPKKKKDYYL